MSISKHLKETGKEFGLWGLAAIVGMALPSAVVFCFAYYVAGTSVAAASSAMTMAVLLSASWGSWSALHWSEKLVPRLMMRVSTSLPGSLLVGLGLLGLYIGRGPIVGWTFLLASGLCVTFVAAALSGKVKFMPSPTPPILRYCAGFVGVPVVSTLFSALVCLLLYVGPSVNGYLNYVPVEFSLFDVVNISTCLVTLLAYTLVTTVIPGASSLFIGQFIDRNAR